jgi:Flp pilus assembly protein TadD
MFSRRLRQFCLALLLAGGAHPGAAGGQERRADPVLAAVELRNAGDLAGAVRLLQGRLREQPDDPEAIRLLAQTLYWLKEFDHARSVYDTALSRHPDNVDIRLEYARMLVEVGDRKDARLLLAPLLDNPAARARALTLIGTLDYWDGRLTAAAGKFRAAIEADSGSTEARRQWREIAMVSAPWVRIGFEAAHDDQPMNRLAPSVQAGVFLTPLWSLELTGRSDGYHSGDSLSQTVRTGAASLKGYAPGLRLETELSGGLIHRSAGASRGDWTGRIQGRIRVPGHLTIGARAERKPYFHTTASLTIPVSVRELTALVGLNDPSGWLGEAALTKSRFPDGNSMTSGYAWLLAPILRRRGNTVSLGYAFSAQDTRESRFVPASSSPPLPPGNPGADLSGRYLPYYTPDNVVVHSAIGSMTLRPGRGTTISTNGAWPVSAHEIATAFTNSGPPPTVQPGSFRRSITPWNVRLSIAQALAPGWSVHAHAEHHRTAFYAASAGGIAIDYRFTSAAARRVDRF